MGLFAILLAALPGLSLFAWVPALVAIGLAIGGFVVGNRGRATAAVGLSIGILAILIGLVVTVVAITLAIPNTDDRGGPAPTPSVSEEAPVSESASDRAVVVWEGQGEGASAKAFLEGDYVVAWETFGSCYYSGDLNGEAFEEVFSASDIASGSNNLYGVEAGDHYLDVITGPAPGCGWKVTLTPQ
ncbi:hypothetical protein [Microbacterium aurum]